MSGEPHCPAVGVGTATGAAVARRFARGGCRVSTVARGAERLAGFAASVPGSRSRPVDIADEAFRTAHRLRSARAFPVEIRPHGESR